MTPGDAALTVDWMVRQYGFDHAEVETWVRDLCFNWPLSVKAMDAEGNVIGLLNMSDYRIEEETSQTFLLASTAFVIRPSSRLSSQSLIVAPASTTTCSCRSCPN